MPSRILPKSTGLTFPFQIDLDFQLITESSEVMPALDIKIEKKHKLDKRTGTFINLLPSSPADNFPFSFSISFSLSLPHSIYYLD